MNSPEAADDNTFSTVGKLPEGSGHSPLPTILLLVAFWAFGLLARRHFATRTDSGPQSGFLCSHSGSQGSVVKSFRQRLIHHLFDQRIPLRQALVLFL